MTTVRTRQVLRISLAATILLGLGGACAQVAGIEDRNFDDAELEPSPQCVEYCDLVGNKADAAKADVPEDYPGVCPQNYGERDMCLGVCAKLPPGDSEVGSENTVACRINAALAAKNEPDESERLLHCQEAGPG